MSASLLRHFEFGMFIAAIAAVFAVGCQQGEPYDAQKPVVEDSTADETQTSLDEAGEDLSRAADATADAGAQVADQAENAADEAADAVTPDEPIVDINTPLGDVFVGRDPVTGDANVDVDAPEADVPETDVDAGDRN